MNAYIIISTSASAIFLQHFVSKWKDVGNTTIKHFIFKDFII